MIHEILKLLVPILRHQQRPHMVLLYLRSAHDSKLVLVKYHVLVRARENVLVALVADRDSEPYIGMHAITILAIHALVLPHVLCAIHSIVCCFRHLIVDTIFILHQNDYY